MTRPHSARRPRLGLACAVAASSLLAGCAGPLSTLEPAGPHAAAVARLWWIMLGGSTLLAGLVFVLLAMAFRRARGREPGRRVWLVWLGLVMPGAVLAALLVYALLLGGAMLPTPAAGGVPIAVEARRYAWTFRYARADGGAFATTGVLHLPAGRPVDLTITTEDVIHSFWIPRLAGKMDAIPGQANRMRLIATRPGVFAGACAEYCGTGHRIHNFRVVAHDAAGWAAFIGGRR